MRAMSETFYQGVDAFFGPHTNEWVSKLPMPTARHGLATVAIDNRIYVIGGGPEPVGTGSNLNEIFQIG
jgi:hypothetical protein